MYQMEYKFAILKICNKRKKDTDRVHTQMHMHTVICLVVCGDLPLFKIVFQVPTM